MKQKPQVISRSLGILGPASVLLLWFVLSESGIVKPLYLPTPKSVLLAFTDLRSTIFYHMTATLARIVVGYLLGAAVGLMIGLIMSYNEYIFAFLNNIIESWRPVPPVALVPFFILWFGFSNTGKIVLVMLGVALVMIVNTLEAIRNVNPIYVRAAFSLGTSKRRVFSSVIFPAILPELRSGFRISLALAISLVIVSEFLGADKGIGYLINVSKVTFNTPTIILGTMLLGLISWLLDFILRTVLDRCTLWSEKYSEAIQ